MAGEDGAAVTPSHVASTIGPESRSRTLRPHRAEIPLLDDWIASVMTDWGAAPRMAFAVRLCIAEIVTNAIEHGAAGDGGDMTVTLLPVDSGVNVEICDSGRPFDPTQVADAPIPLSIETAQVGGWGMKLVRAFADQIVYRREGECNRLSLRISGASA